MPNTPFCYWVSGRIRRLFKELPPFESDGRTVKQGLATADDFRFVRAWWEVPAGRILDSMRYAVGGRQDEREEKWTEERVRDFQAWCRKRTYEGKRWVPFAKGGEYSPYYADIHLLVNWEKDGEEIRNFVDPKTGKINSRPQNTDYYFRPGLTWPRSTVKGLNMRLLPASCVFADKGPSGFVPELERVYSVLGLFNSECYQVMVGLQQGSRAWEVGTIQKTAIPLLEKDQKLNKCTLRIWHLKRLLDLDDETSHAFVLPAFMTRTGSTLTERAAAFGRHTVETEQELRSIQSAADEIAFNLYGFTEKERKTVGGGQWAVGSRRWRLTTIRVKKQPMEKTQKMILLQTPNLFRPLTTDN